MKRLLLSLLTTALLAPLTGCIHVERDEPESATTTTTHRTTTTTAPVTGTTVERTTVY
jgi:hypothetical protein